MNSAYTSQIDIAHSIQSVARQAMGSIPRGGRGAVAGQAGGAHGIEEGSSCVDGGNTLAPESAGKWDGDET